MSRDTLLYKIIGVEWSFLVVCHKSGFFMVLEHRMNEVGVKLHAHRQSVCLSSSSSLFVRSLFLLLH